MLGALFLLFAFISTEVESLQLPSPQRIPPKPTSDSLEEVALAEAKCGSLILPNIAVSLEKLLRTIYITILREVETNDGRVLQS